MSRNPCAVTLAAAALSFQAFPMAATAADTDTKVLGRVVVTDEEADYVARESTTATKIAAPIRDIPQAIVVVDQALLRDRGVAKLNEALDTVAGVVRESVYGGNTATAGFLARGFRAAQLRDGLRLNIQGFGDALDIGAVERIEVLKGPASVLYGTSEPGGTINIVSKAPHPDAALRGDAALNSFGTARLGLDLNAPLLGDSLLMRVNLAHEDGDTYRDFVDRRTSLLAPSVEWRAGERTTVTLRYEHVRTEGLFDRGLGWVDAYLDTPIDYRDLPVERFVGEPTQKPARNDTSQILARLDQQLGEAWTLRFAYSDVQFDWASQAEINLDSYDPTTGLFDRYYGDYTRQGENTRVLYSELSGTFELGGMTHQLLVGADRLENRAFYIGLNGDPAPVPLDVLDPVYSGYDVAATFWFSGLQGSEGRSLYLQDLITLGPRWKALLAARRDDSERYSGAYPGQPDDTGPASRHEFSRISPRAGLVFQPNDGDSLYGSFSTSFMPALFINLRDPTDFKPEIGKQFEIGWKRAWAGGRIASTLSLFDIRKRNVAQSDPTNVPDEEFFEVQVGEFHSRGVEFDASGELMKGLRGSLGVGFAKVTVSESEDPSLPVGERLDNFPRLTASLWLTRELGAAWSVGAGVFHSGGAPTALPDNGVSLPSWTRVDAAVTWRNDACRVQLAAKNLNDEKYYAASNTIMPQPPRHAVLSVTYDF